MWGGVSGVPQPAGMYAGATFNQSMQPQQAAAAAPAQKHDIFVGNLSFNTTEEQIQQAFSEIGKVINVRLVSDLETGKPRGFAFVEFSDPQAALSAIRNMNDYELNGRRLRVNFSNSSHLEALAGKLGMDLTQQTQRQTTTNAPVQAPSAASAGTNAVADALKDMSKAEMYDVVAKLKEIADRDPDEARRMISAHPQLPEALLFLMSKLDMVKTPVSTEAPAPVLAPVVRAADPRARADPRQAAAAVAATTTVVSVPPPPSTSRVDPRQQRVDPRQAARAAASVTAPAGAPPLPPAYSAVSMSAVPPPPPPQHHTGSVTHLDPALVQQVMSLTPLQIQQLPPDKRQSILQLRQQITGSAM